MGKRTPPPDRYARYCERERLRAAKRRAENVQVRRPAPVVVDRAIVAATAEAWAEQIAALSPKGDTLGSRQAAVLQPVSIQRIADLAIANLICLREAAREHAIQMVGDRLLPTPNRIRQARMGAPERQRRETREMRVKYADASRLTHEGVTEASDAS